MPQYLIGVHHGSEARERPPEVWNPIHAAVTALNEEVMADGSFVFAGGLADPSATTTIDSRSGTPVITDGPYIETKEFMGGFWVMEFPDLDAALAFGQRAAGACQDVIEVRPFLDAPPQRD